MQPRYNEFGQMIGPAMLYWTPAEPPAKVTLQGTFCHLTPLDPAAHSEGLFEAYAAAPDDSLWTYLRHGPFPTLQSFRAWADSTALLDDPFTFTVVENATGNAVGTLALMRIDCANGSIEVGNVTFSPAIQRTAISTEAQFLLMNYIFESLGYRRYEWKCDSYNAPSINAAKRLGFQYEGTFRNAVVYNGRSRDTAWFSITDSEWQILRAGYHRWLSPDNFKDGKQVMRLQKTFNSRN